MTINQAIVILLAAAQRAHLEDAASSDTCDASIIWRCSCEAARAYTKLKAVAHKLEVAKVPGTRKRRTKAEMSLAATPTKHYPLKRTKPMFRVTKDSL